jgi:hypothetical protein
MMRSHLASATLVGIALLVAGCGGGGSPTHGFGALPKAAPATPAAPPVVLAEPAPSSTPAAPAAKPAAPLTTTDAKALAKSRATAKKLRHQRAIARHRLRVERRKAAAREAKLRQELAAAKIVSPAPAPSHRATQHKVKPAPIAASDVTDDKQRAARVVVVRFYDLMNSHDGSACDMLSVRFLHDHFPGDDTDAQRANCSTGVQSLQSPVSVYIQGSGTEASGIWVRVVSHLGDGQAQQVIHLVPFFSSWMIDAVDTAPSR